MTDFAGRISGLGAQPHFQPVSGDWLQTDDGLWVAVHGHPFTSETEQATGTRLVAEAYRRHGEGLLNVIRGDFALVVVDTTRGTVTGAVDRTGQHQLYHTRQGDCLTVATTAGLTLEASGGDRRLSHQDLFHYLYFHMIPAPGTAFAGIGKLQAAHSLIVKNNRYEVAPYWVPQFLEPDSADTDELMARLQQAVARAVDGEGRTGAFLSGGLDSSTVAGLLARLRAGDADTFSIGFDAEGYDEMPYARCAAGHFGTRAHEYYVTPDDVVRMVPRIAAAYDEPFGNSSALPAYFCARMAAEAGMKCLLAGDGGDELFAGNERYAKQGVFSRWERIPAPLRQGLLEPVLTRLPRRPNLLRKARSYVDQARTPLPDRLQSYNFMHRIDPAHMLADDFLASLELEEPLRLQRSIYGRPADASELNRMMYLDWQITLADNDLRKVTRMCQLAGVGVAFPMLDDELVEYSLRVPSRLKLKDGRLRHFYKETMKGFLPGEIIEKKKHGFGLPFGVWMGRHPPLRELAYDSITSLKTRGFLRPAFIDEAIRLHQDGHAGYYGELIWVLMMLELWLQEHT